MPTRMKSKSKTMQDVEKENHQQLTARDGDALLTAREGDALRSYLSRLDKETAPTITFSEDGSEISIGHPDQKIGWLLLTQAFGTTNDDFAMNIIVDLMDASRDGLQFNPAKFRAMLAMFTSFKPRDESAARLILHTTLTSFAITKTARQMAAAENIMKRECAQRMFSKLKSYLP